MKQVYHCSPIGEIEVFEPDLSKGIKVVYATPYKMLAYDFGIAEHNDYIIHPIIDTNSNTMRLVEMAPDALDRYYEHQSAYLYTFDAKDFNVPMQWAGEVASDKPVKPLSVTFIPDLKAAILDEVKNGNLEFLPFEQRNKYGDMDRFFAIRALSGGVTDNDEYFQYQMKYFQELENKEIFNHARNILNMVTRCITEPAVSIAENGVLEEKRVIPRAYLEKYRNADGQDDKSCIQIIKNLFWMAEDHPEDVPVAVRQLQGLGNKKLIKQVGDKCRYMQKLMP